MALFPPPAVRGSPLQLVFAILSLQVSHVANQLWDPWAAICPSLSLSPPLNIPTRRNPELSILGSPTCFPGFYQPSVMVGGLAPHAPRTLWPNADTPAVRVQSTVVKETVQKEFCSHFCRSSLAIVQPQPESLLPFPCDVFQRIALRPESVWGSAGCLHDITA